eukprot:TRINITY_DN26914_c0_g1_i1.p1 TRINITY_DN26914_c0_g1~~TRINITY_DN26914_c0_g1_i1.p1  ORF type:complete len:261 (+),score=22.22 TRINITY_DN26914_c0_g1_i1:117-785(+)
MCALQHDNILRLLGACLDATSDSMAIVYEFIPNGNVAQRLEAVRQGTDTFTWAQRLKVAIGCAELLAFIHNREYVHRNFKGSNVLLTEDMDPRVADFGVARIVEDWKDHVTTRIMGSRGYLDPGYQEAGFLNEHCDTYAFGVFLVELASGKPITDPSFEATQEEAVKGSQANLDTLMDPSIKGQYTKEQAEGLLEVVKAAITLDWEERPPMEQLAENLKGLL